MNPQFGSIVNIYIRKVIIKKIMNILMETQINKIKNTSKLVTS